MPVRRPATRPPVTDSAVASVEPASAAQLEHDRFHRVVVDAEHEVADLGTHDRFPLVELGDALVERRRPSR